MNEIRQHLKTVNSLDWWCGYPLHIDDVLEPEADPNLDLFEIEVTMTSNALEFLLPD